MMQRLPHAQIDDYSRAGEALTVGRRAVNCSHRPAHGERGVGYRSPTCFDAYFLPRSTGGDLNRSRPFSHSNCSLRTSRRCLSRQRVGAFPPPRTRLAATFIPLRVLGRSRQFGFPHNRIRQDRNVPESHKPRTPFACVGCLCPQPNHEGACTWINPLAARTK